MTFTLLPNMALQSGLTATYDNRSSKTRFALLPDNGNSRTSPAKSPLNIQSREPFLPRIRVEECGLTVEARDRDSWKRENKKKGTGISWRPGKKRRGKYRHASEDEIKAAQAINNGDSFQTREQRDIDADATGRLVYSLGQPEMTSEFVDSLKVGGFHMAGNKHSNNSRLQRAISWPVGKLRYSSPGTLQNQTDSFHSNNLSKTQLTPFLSLHTVEQSNGNVSRERVILNRLATKRKHHSPSKPAHDALGNRQIMPADNRLSPINNDQFLSPNHYGNQSTFTDSQTYNSYARHFMRGYEYYEIIDDATQKLLEVHHSNSSSGVSSSSGSSASRAGTSGYETLDDWSVQSRGHCYNCPMCDAFKPSEVGHLCPPNSPLIT